MVNSMCGLQKERDTNGQPTLGIFKPKAITSFKIEKVDKPEWTEKELASLRKVPLFGERPHTELKKLPYDFSYEFQCHDLGCRGHKMKCTDWEVGASFWDWKQKYGSNWEQYFRQMYETKMIRENDTHFFVGTLNTHPSEWIIIGLFYPPKQNQAIMPM